jgi:hypothetical protein
MSVLTEHKLTGLSSVDSTVRGVWGLVREADVLLLAEGGSREVAGTGLLLRGCYPPHCSSAMDISYPV